LGLAGSRGEAERSSHSRSASVTGRRSGEIIEEEDEDEVEEVDHFSPLSGPGEVVEQIFGPGTNDSIQSAKEKDMAP